jgi:hypothetical protein
MHHCRYVDSSDAAAFKAAAFERVSLPAKFTQQPRGKIVAVSDDYLSTIPNLKSLGSV